MHGEMKTSKVKNQRRRFFVNLKLRKRKKHVSCRPVLPRESTLILLQNKFFGIESVGTFFANLTADHKLLLSPGTMLLRTLLRFVVRKNDFITLSRFFIFVLRSTDGLFLFLFINLFLWFTLVFIELGRFVFFGFT